ncbi:MAG: Gfo/Idh/MocA family protein [Planctomycetota bacterium]|jgi:predicted dehydrogenase
MIKVGIIGLGFMGKMHFDNYAALKNVKVVAIADIDKKKRAGDWSGIVGNIAGKAKGPNLKGITMYDKAEKLIKDPNVDVVDIALPTNLHSRYVLKSLAAKKPTICEKPMARTSAEAAKMAAAAKKNKVPLFVGHCIRFWPEYAKVKEIIDSKKYGKVLQATFCRFSLSPTWSWDNWLLDYKRSGGAALDLHIHDTDFIQYLFGKPESINANMAGFKPGQAEHIRANYTFKGKNNLIVTTEGGWLYTPGFGFTMNFRIHCEKATITYDCNAAPTLAIHPRKGKSVFPKVKAGDGYSNELAYFMQCIARGVKPTVITPESSAYSVKMIEAEVKSAKMDGKPVKV